MCMRACVLACLCMFLISNPIMRHLPSHYLTSICMDDGPMIFSTRLLPFIFFLKCTLNFLDDKHLCTVFTDHRQQKRVSGLSSPCFSHPSLPLYCLCFVGQLRFNLAQSLKAGGVCLDERAKSYFLPKKLFFHFI